MSVKTGQLVVREFDTVDASGAAADATVGPVGTLILNGAANGATVTIGHPAVGRYTWSVTMPTLAAGDSVDMHVTMTVGGVATHGVVWQDTADKYVNDLNNAPAAPAMITAQQVRDAMKLDATIGAPAVGSIDKHLDDAALEATLTAIKGLGWTTQTLIAIYNAIVAVGLGGGSVTFPYTLTDSISGLPLADAEVWVTTDALGVNVVARGRTDNFGIITVYLDPGTYYFWRAKSGFSGVNPDVEAVP
jgi:hypothetical protein